MTQLKYYVSRLRMTIGHRNKPSGIPWQTGQSIHDFYPKPQMAFCWYQPDSSLMEEVPGEKKSGLRDWLSKLGK